MTIGIVINALFFLGMGISAIVKPISVVYFVNLVPDTIDARNEVRAVYGGFGVSLAVLLVIAAYNSDIRAGVLITVAAALFGMAAGRALSLIIERPGKWPVIFMCMEAALASLLVYSL